MLSYDLFSVKTTHEVVNTLLEALALVVLVVFLFLQNWRATLIPVLAIPVSLPLLLTKIIITIDQSHLGN